MKKPFSGVQALLGLTIQSCGQQEGRWKLSLDFFSLALGSAASLALKIDIRGLRNASRQSHLTLGSVSK